MAIWDKWFRRERNRADPGISTRPMITGRKSSHRFTGTLSPYRARTSNVLAQLRSYRDEVDAIEFLRKVTPDVSMAVWNFLRLGNQGHTMEFQDLNGQPLPAINDEWRNFAARVNEISNAGLDALIDIFHYNAFVKGGQGVEVEVTPNRMEIYDVYPVDPQTLYWELEERNGRKKWIPYQYQMPHKVSLESGKANFFWVPTDATAEDPRGTLHLAPVLQSIDFQIQTMQDLQMVLHRQGWPRNDIEIVTETLMNIMPGDVKGSKVKMAQWMQERFDAIVDMMNNLEPDSDYIHFDDTKINLAQGGNAARSLDVRAIAELVDQQVMTGAKQLSVFMNRNTGVTETFGTVQFKIAVGGIASIQRGSKRLVEEIARLWLRVKGIQAVPHFTHNLLDWQSEEQRMKVKLMTEEFWAIAQLMRWVDRDQAAQEVTGVQRAAGDPIENVRVSFSRIGGVQPDVLRGKNDGKGQNRPTAKESSKVVSMPKL